MPRPEFIYKILPHSSVDSRFTFPIPIPASHQFFLSPLDMQDGFVHFSTGKQIPGTLNRFFQDVPAVTLLRCETDRLASWKRLSWDTNEGEEYPHLHAQLEGENIDSFKDVHREGKSWDTVLEGLQKSGWLA
ncbi:hypothetical protein P7C73_g633, partial [Tremellales sp. Uapishka_1]